MSYLYRIQFNLSLQVIQHAIEMECGEFCIDLYNILLKLKEQHYFRDSLLDELIKSHTKLKQTLSVQQLQLDHLYHDVTSAYSIINKQNELIYKLYYHLGLDVNSDTTTTIYNHNNNNNNNNNILPVSGNSMNNNTTNTNTGFLPATHNNNNGINNNNQHQQQAFKIPKYRPPSLPLLHSLQQRISVTRDTSSNNNNSSSINNNNNVQNNNQQHTITTGSNSNNNSVINLNLDDLQFQQPIANEGEEDDVPILLIPSTTQNNTNNNNNNNQQQSASFNSSTTTSNMNNNNNITNSNTNQQQQQQNKKIIQPSAIFNVLLNPDPLASPGAPAPTLSVSSSHGGGGNVGAPGLGPSNSKYDRTTPFDTIRYYKTTAITHEDHILLSEQCAVCNNIYQRGDRITFTCCGHNFHESCLYTWFSLAGQSTNTSTKTCCICRRKLQD
eukprot:UN04649